MAHGDVKSIVDSPWTSVGTSDTAQEYLVLLTYLPLKGYRKMMTLMRRSRAVSHQLAKTPGLIGFTFRAKLFRHRFWTLSAWEDERPHGFRGEGPAARHHEGARAAHGGRRVLPLERQ